MQRRALEEYGTGKTAREDICRFVRTKLNSEPTGTDMILLSLIIAAAKLLLLSACFVPGATSLQSSLAAAMLHCQGQLPFAVIGVECRRLWPKRRALS